MALLDREAILARNDLPRELVAVPEWGGEVYVRGLTLLERDRLEAQAADVMAALANGLGSASLRAKLLALTVCDEHGQPLFDDADAAKLATKSTAATERLVEAALRLSLMVPGSLEATVERAVGNSDSGQSAAFSSDSPLPSERP